MKLKSILESKSNDELIKMGNKFMKKWDDSMYPEVLEWITYFKKSGKAPRGMSKVFKDIQYLHGIADRKPNFVPQPVTAMFGWWDHYGYDMKEIVEKLANKNETTKVILNGVTYYNYSSMSEKRFISTTKKIDSFFKNFKSKYKLPLQKNLEVHFKYSKEIRAKAVYKSLLDQIWVKESSKVDTEAYGHLLYILVHELGHRIQKIFPYETPPVDFDKPEWWTTDYSRKEGESFAELYAINFFGVKAYPEYKKQIEDFKQIFK